MWKDDNQKMKDLVAKTGSPYAACMYAAKKGRQLQKESYNVLSESAALSWAISGSPPKDIEERIQSRMKQENVEIQESDKLENILSSIEEENIRIAVKNSYRASTRLKRITYDYNGIKDKGIRTRIRILVRMAVLG